VTAARRSEPERISSPLPPLRPGGPSRIPEEIKVGDAPLDERHPGVGEEVLDLLPPAGGEVIDDDDVVVLC